MATVPEVGGMTMRRCVDREGYRMREKFRHQCLKSHFSVATVR